jgi:hypothetical protein
LIQKGQILFYLLCIEIVESNVSISCE